MEITEKVAYLKGLTEGLGLDTETKEGKILSAMIDILDDMALEIEDMKDNEEELSDGLDAVSDDLEDVEDIVYGDEDDMDDEEGVIGAHLGEGWLDEITGELRGIASDDRCAGAFDHPPDSADGGRAEAVVGDEQSWEYL